MGEQAASDNRLRSSLWERLQEWHPRTSRPTNGDAMSRTRWQELRAKVQANRPLRVELVDLPGTDATLHITTRWFPQIPGRFSGAPYWSEIWPSGVVLAGVIARDPGLLRGRRVLELGPGWGLPRSPHSRPAPI